MAPARIIAIRHGEKPDDDGRIFGVDVNGRNDPHSLSPRGWQRAGALVGFFFPRDGRGGDARHPLA